EESAVNKSLSAIIASASARSPAIAAQRSPATPVRRSAMAAKASGQVASTSLPARAEPVDGEARLVGNPLLVDVLVEARQDAQHGWAAGIDPNVRADGIEHVDRFRLAQFPGPRDEGIRFGGQGADRAQIDNVAG